MFDPGERIKGHCTFALHLLCSNPIWPLKIGIFWIIQVGLYFYNICFVFDYFLKFE